MRTPRIVAATTEARVTPIELAERHGLIIIVALGESIVAIGVGMAGLAISWGVIAASVLVCAALWWAYFDVTALMGRRLWPPNPKRAARGWPETRTASCTCRWWSGSCCWRWD